MPTATKNSDPSWFGFPLTINENAKFSRVDYLKHLDEHNIGTRLMFGGNLKLQPAFENVNLKSNSELKIANKVVQDSFWLGLFPGITFEMIDYIAEVTEDFIKSG